MLTGWSPAVHTWSVIPRSEGVALFRFVLRWASRLQSREDWMRASAEAFVRARLLLVGGLSVTLMGLAACTSTTTTVIQHETGANSQSQAGDGESLGLTEVPDVVGMDLQSAQDTLQAHGFYNLGSHDVTGESSFQILDRDWRVVNQDPAAGTMAADADRVELGVVRR
jgi:hypothetical protein